MHYNSFEESDYAAVSALVGDKNRVLYSEEISEDYSHDELSGTRCMPDVVVKVVNTAEVSALLAYANRRRIPVTPRGSGTSLVGAAVPIKRGILLDLSPMNQI